MNQRLCSLFLVALPYAAGCGAPGGSLRATIKQYESGNVNAASRECWDVSQDAEYLSDKAHTRYLVYCGLTHYRLGRRGEGQRLLVQGNMEYLDGKSSWLKPAIVDELYKALDDLEGRPHMRPTRESFRKRR